MLQPVMELGKLCRTLRAAGWEEQAERIMRAADALEVSLHVDSAEAWMVYFEAFRAEQMVGAAMLKRHGGG